MLDWLKRKDYNFWGTKEETEMWLLRIFVYLVLVPGMLIMILGMFYFLFYFLMTGLMPVADPNGFIPPWNI